MKRNRYLLLGFVTLMLGSCSQDDLQPDPGETQPPVGTPTPAPKPDPKPAPKPDPKPAPKPDPKPAPKPDPKPGKNKPPVATFDFIADKLNVKFKDKSTDADGKIKSWFWDFGNGYDSKQQNPILNYRGPGTFTVKLTVIDDKGAKNITSKQITLRGGKPKRDPKPTPKPPKMPCPPDGPCPVPQPAPKPTPPSGDFGQQVLSLVNASRASGATCGGRFMPAVGALTYNNKLAQAAQSHSQDMANRNYFNHRSPDGRGPGARIRATGYQAYTWAENIAAGASSARAVHKMWMKSAGHCRNVMNGRLKEMGMGYVKGGKYRHLWTQVFGTSRR